MRILNVGEIVAGPGRKAVQQVLPEVIKQYRPDFIFANAENLSGGRGVTPEKLDEMKQAGVDYFTGGDHIFWERGTEDIIDSLSVLRPANYPEGAPGKGYTVLDLGKNGSVLLINLMGRTSFGSANSYLDDPFKKADAILEEVKDQKFTAKIIDFHAEASSEKMAFGFYMDGKVDVVTGSHTHIPSADGFRLPKGTLYLSDVGMTGVIDSVLGVEKDVIINLFMTARNQRFEWARTGRKAFRSVLFDTDKAEIIRIDKEI